MRKATDDWVAIRGQLVEMLLSHADETDAFSIVSALPGKSWCIDVTPYRYPDSPLVIEVPASRPVGPMEAMLQNKILECVLMTVKKGLDRAIRSRTFTFWLCRQDSVLEMDGTVSILCHREGIAMGASSIVITLKGNEGEIAAEFPTNIPDKLMKSTLKLSEWEVAAIAMIRR